MRVSFANNQPSILKQMGLYRLPENKRLENLRKQQEQTYDSLKKGILGGTILGLMSLVYFAVKKSPNKILNSLSIFAASAMSLHLYFLSKYTYENIKEYNESNN